MKIHGKTKRTKKKAKINPNHVREKALMLKLNKDRSRWAMKILLICFNNIKINKTFKDIINEIKRKGNEEEE